MAVVFMAAASMAVVGVAEDLAVAAGEAGAVGGAVMAEAGAMAVMAMAGDGAMAEDGATAVRAMAEVGDMAGAIMGDATAQ